MLLKTISLYLGLIDLIRPEYGRRLSLCFLRTCGLRHRRAIVARNHLADAKKWFTSTRSQTKLDCLPRRIAPLLFFIAGCASREAGMQQQASGSTQRPQLLVGNLYGNRRAPQES